jgi:uncharacterized cupredoxin-like copper-binding protein
MHQKRFGYLLFSASCVALTAWLLAVTGSASGKSTRVGAARVTVVSVTAGKPSELAFKLSKFSLIPVGTIVFKVTNAGLAFHNFKICSAPALTAVKNTCVGKATAILKHGQTATLTVILTKSGKYEFMCAVPGHAAAGMKGLIGVGVTVTASQSTASTSSTTSGGSGGTSSPTSGAGTTTTTATTTTTTPAGGGGGAGGAECPAGTTIAQAAAGGGDHDDDDTGGPTDGDGCI